MPSHRYSRMEVPGLERRRWKWHQALGLARVTIDALELDEGGSVAIVGHHAPPWSLRSRLPVRIVETRDGDKWVLTIAVGSSTVQHEASAPHDPFAVAERWIAPHFATSESDLRALVLLETGARGI